MSFGKLLVIKVVVISAVSADAASLPNDSPHSDDAISQDSSCKPKM